MKQKTLESIKYWVGISTLGFMLVSLGYLLCGELGCYLGVIAGLFSMYCVEIVGTLEEIRNELIEMNVRTNEDDEDEESAIERHNAEVRYKIKNKLF